jgi:transposase-like protein
MYSRDKLIALIKEGSSFLDVSRVALGDVYQDILSCLVNEFIDTHQEDLGGGRRRLVRNGWNPERDVLLPPMAVTLQTPKVWDRKGGGRKPVFESDLLPNNLRRAKELDECIPWMYLKGVSQRDFKHLFELSVGRPVKGLSATTINGLLSGWSAEFSAWETRELSGTRYPYVWCDGVHFPVAGEKENASELVALGVREDGRKELLAITEGYAETASCWEEMFRGFRARGMESPKLVIGDGGKGLWSALSRVYPDCARQYCWFHKIQDVHRHLPKERHGGATKRLRDVYMSDTRAEAARKIELLADVWGVKHPKAAETLTKYADGLLTYYSFPAEHWTQLRTTNPLESMFSTLRLRTDKTRGRVSRGRLGTLVFKLATAAASKMRILSRADKLKLVLDGVVFKDGLPAE